MAVDIWILEVRDPPQAIRGLMKLFGLPHAQCKALLSSVPCRVKRDVAEGDAPRYQEKLKSIGAIVTWCPAGESVPPPPLPVVPPNEPPEELVEVPSVPGPFEGKRTRLYWGLVGVGLLGVVSLALIAPGLSSGEAGLPTAIAGGVLLGVLAIGTFGSVLSSFRLAMASPILPLACGALATVVCVLVIRSSEPDPQERLAHVRELRAEVLGGQAPEARAFLSGNGTLDNADATRSRAFVESLYESGARRVLVIDEDDDGEAEWIAIDMPVLPDRRNAIRGAVRSFVGEDFSQIPPELATPSLAQHWIFPIDIH